MVDEFSRSHGIIGVSESDVAALRKLRLRERIGLFLYRWWAPLASGATGLATGAALMLAEGGRSSEELTDSYPYAAAARGLHASSSRSTSRTSIVLALSVVAFAISFIAGIGVGGAASGESELGIVTRYGVLGSGGARDE